LQFGQFKTTISGGYTPDHEIRENVLLSAEVRVICRTVVPHRLLSAASGPGQGRFSRLASDFWAWRARTGQYTGGRCEFLRSPQSIRGSLTCASSRGAWARLEPIGAPPLSIPWSPPLTDLGTVELLSILRRIESRGARRRFGECTHGPCCFRTKGEWSGDPRKAARKRDMGHWKLLFY